MATRFRSAALFVAALLVVVLSAAATAHQRGHSIGEHHRFLATTKECKAECKDSVSDCKQKCKDKKMMSMGNRDLKGSKSKGSSKSAKSSGGMNKAKNKEAEKKKKQAWYVFFFCFGVSTRSSMQCSLRRRQQPIRSSTSF